MVCYSVDVYVKNVKLSQKTRFDGRGKIITDFKEIHFFFLSRKHCKCSVVLSLKVILSVGEFCTPVIYLKRS